MITTRFDYTFDEFLEMTYYNDATIGEFLESAFNAYEVSAGLAGLIKSLYGDWFVLSLLDSDPDHVRAWAIKKAHEIFAWNEIHSGNYQKMLDVDFNVASKNVSRFNDTPESQGDYSSLEHTTTITSNETNQNNPLNDFNRLKENYKLRLANAFRKRFLRWLGGDE